MSSRATSPLLRSLLLLPPLLHPPLPRLLSHPRSCRSYPCSLDILPTLVTACPVFTPAGADPASDFRLRQKVILATPALAALHRSLMLSGQLTETEFWAQRTHLFTAQTAADAQVRGRPGQPVDPRPETVDGEVRIIITPQPVHDIFEEYPMVVTAYSDVGARQAD